MATLQRVLPLCAMLLAPAAGAELRLELPPGEPIATWEPVLQSMGLVAGSADTPPWARLVAEPDGGCHLDVATSWGASLSERVPCPSTTFDREEVAALAVLMLEPMVRGERSVASLPTQVGGPRDDDAPAGKRRLRDPSGAGETVPSAESPSIQIVPPSFEIVDGQGRRVASGTADLVLAERPEGSSGGPSGTQLGDRLEASQPTVPIAQATGTTQFNPLCFYTDCAVSFDRRRCGMADGCSTAEKCPDTYWLDFDRDGFGNPQTCLSLANEQGVGAWVQNVGDCDDRHSSVHPGADEVVGDGIDNDCDGVAR